MPLLKIGQTVRLGIGGGDMPFAGTIRGIDPKIDPASRLVTVRAEVANPEGKLTPGQFVQVRVELPEENNVLALPQTALTSSLYGDFIFVVHRPSRPKAPRRPSRGKAGRTGSRQAGGGCCEAGGCRKARADATKPAADDASGKAR